MRVPDDDRKLNADERRLTFHSRCTTSGRGRSDAATAGRPPAAAAAAGAVIGPRRITVAWPACLPFKRHIGVSSATVHLQALSQSVIRPDRRRPDRQLLKLGRVTPLGLSRISLYPTNSHRFDLLIHTTDHQRPTGIYVLLRLHGSAEGWRRCSGTRPPHHRRCLLDEDDNV